MESAVSLRRPFSPCINWNPCKSTTNKQRHKQQQKQTTTTQTNNNNTQQNLSTLIEQGHRRYELFKSLFLYL